MKPANTAKAGISIGSLPRDYTGLIGVFPLRPLHDEIDLANATVIVDAMAGHDLTRDQEDYLDVLSDLVRRYEDEHHPLPPDRSTPLARLRYLMEQAGMTASDLGRLLGNRGLGSVLLAGRRQLSKRHIVKLARHFKISTDYFL
ncbi:MAG: type II toxin-antitoxin system HigA family antitoxin [Phycisphaerae bacterium]